MQIGTIESIWRYPVKGMRGEELPYVYTAYTGVMGDRIYAVAAADGDPGHPWHTGRNQEEFVLYKATYSEWEPGIDPLYPDADAFKVSIARATRLSWNEPKQGKRSKRRAAGRREFSPDPGRHRPPCANRRR